MLRCQSRSPWRHEGGSCHNRAVFPTSLAQAAMEFEPIVRIYESRLWRRGPLVALALGIGFDAELATILGAAGLTPDATVLDLACGPGIYARPLARRAPAGRVVGLDLSAPMLRMAGHFAYREALPNLTFVRGNAVALPFVAARFDVVNCCGALHLFPDVQSVLAEVRRVLRPGGRFTVAAFRRPDGQLSTRMNQLRRATIGIDAFTTTGLVGLLGTAGLGEVRIHYARRSWQIVSASRS